MNSLFIAQLQEIFFAHSNSSIAMGQSAYLKHKFQFLGIKKPQRSELEKIVISQHKIMHENDLIDLVCALWKLPYREFHYTALTILIKYKKLWTINMLPVLEMLITQNSWWDSVDTIATQMVGMFLQKYPDYQEYTNTWLMSNNIWLQRTALLYQLKYKKQTDTQRLFAYIKVLMHHKDFFIRKAIGWSLREYSKTNKQEVAEFLREHKAHLSNLSYREASKYLLTSQI
jgi:3-methyladenine DNA glycosylase AlkD